MAGLVLSIVFGSLQTDGWKFTVASFGFSLVGVILLQVLGRLCDSGVGYHVKATVSSLNGVSLDEAIQQCKASVNTNMFMGAGMGVPGMMMPPGMTMTTDASGNMVMGMAGMDPVQLAMMTQQLAVMAGTGGVMPMAATTPAHTAVNIPLSSPTMQPAPAGVPSSSSTTTYSTSNNPTTATDSGELMF